MRIRNPLSGPPPWNRSWKSYRTVGKLWNRYAPAVPCPDGTNRNVELASYLSDATLVTRQTATGDHLELLAVAGGEPKRFLTSKGSETNGQISPDGKWVVYASDESGEWEIYVTSFPDVAGKWQVSRGGGGEPRWRGDGKEIYYIGPNGMLMAVPVNGADIFATGTPVPLFQIRGRAPISSTDIFTYDVAKDGNRFLVNRYEKPEHIPPLTILLNAPAGSL